MISHEHKCIFIHIQSTNGTFIERWIQGDDQWNIKHNWKHITTKFAKERLYSEYWDDYFKFTIVRNPYERILDEISTGGMFQWRHLGLNLIDPENRFLNISPENYRDIHCNGGAFINNLGWDGWNEPIQINCIYKNILSEGVDKIYKYEEFEDAIKDISKILDKDIPKNIDLDLSYNKDVDKLKPVDYEIINQMYELDFNEYEYEKQFV